MKRKLTFVLLFFLGNFLSAAAQASADPICQQIMRTAWRQTCGTYGAYDSADCYIKSKITHEYSVDEYNTYWHALCRNRSDRATICSRSSLNYERCKEADCGGMRPEWTFTIGDKDGDPC
jgi:hypothetical protein